MAVINEKTKKKNMGFKNIKRPNNQDIKKRPENQTLACPQYMIMMMIRDRD